MGCLCMNSDDSRGVVGDVFIVEREAGGTYELVVAMFGFVVRMAVREWIPFNWL